MKKIEWKESGGLTTTRKRLIVVRLAYNLSRAKQNQSLMFQTVDDERINKTEVLASADYVLHVPRV